MPASLASASHIPGRVDSADVIRRLCGEEAAAALCNEFAGQRLYIPLDPPPSGSLAQLIGLPAARALAAEWGGDCLNFPVAEKRMARIREMTLNRVSVSQIITELECSRTTVYRVRRELKAAGLLPKKPRSKELSPSQAAEAESLFKLGLQPGAVARTMKASKRQVRDAYSRWLAEAGGS